MGVSYPLRQSFSQLGMSLLGVRSLMVSVWRSRGSETCLISLGRGDKGTTRLGPASSRHNDEVSVGLCEPCKSPRHTWRNAIDPVDIPRTRTSKEHPQSGLCYQWSDGITSLI